MRQRGLSLLECLVTVFLSIIIMQLISYVYIGSIQTADHISSTFQSDHELIRIFKILEDDIKQAGYMGCKKLVPNEMIYPYLKYNFKYENQLTINKNELTVRHASLPFSTLLSSQLNRITVSAETPFENNELILISDCFGGEIAKVTQVINCPKTKILQLANKLQRHYGAEAEVSHFVMNHYYVDKSQLMVEDSNGNVDAISDVAAIYFSYYVIRNNELMESNSSATDAGEIVGVKIQVNMNDHGAKKTLYHYISRKDVLL